MAFRGEVHDDVGMLLLKKLIDGGPVTDVRLYKAEVGMIHNGGQGGQVARVGQLVQTHDPVIRVLSQHVEDEIAADESGAAGDNDGHRKEPLSLSRFCGSF